MIINIFARVKDLEKRIKDLEGQVASFNIRLEALGWDFDGRQRQFEEEVRRRTSDGRIITLIQDYWHNNVLVHIIKDRYVGELKTRGTKNEATK